MKIASIGVFGTSVWAGLTVIMGGTVLLSIHVGAKEGLVAKTAILVSALTAACVVVVVLAIYLFDTQLTLVASIEKGTLDVAMGSRVGSSKKRLFAFDELESASVEDHGEDNVAAVLHTRKEEPIPIFPTRIGDDARRVVAFVEDALAAWR